MKDLFKNKKVVVMGLGLHGGGVGAVKFFVKQSAEVLATDLKTKKQLKESIAKLKGLPVKYVLGRHRKEDFINADLIIKNPDVSFNSPYLKIARKNGVAIETDINLFFNLSEAFIIGVTGTKGKSTTATLIYHFLKSRYSRTFLAGNIGISPLELFLKISVPQFQRSLELRDTKKNRDSKNNRKFMTLADKVVLELSSFELEGLKKSPQVAVFTNILDDHLNRYKSRREYIEAKKPIFKNQNKSDILVLNYDDPIVKKFSSISQNYFYSRKEKKDVFLKGDDIFFDAKKSPTADLKDFKLLGKHNISNLLAAVLTAKLLKVPCENIRKVIKNFKGVPFRQEFVKEIKGVKYFNDTTATMPDAVIEVLKAVKEKFPLSSIILIAGGQDKNLDYKKMALEIRKKASFVVFLPGTATDKLKKLLKNAKIFSVGSMEEAVKKSSELAEKGDIVILSPGAASFNLFKNEFDRGEQFNKALKKLK